MRLLAAVVAVAIGGFCVQPAHARGGGGCLAAGTMIDTPEGPRAIETLVAGDRVRTGLETAGTTEYAEVLETPRYEATDWLELEVGGQRIVTTAEHPFFTSESTLSLAGKLAVGQTVLSPSGTALPVTRILAHHHEPRPVYNLLTAPPNRYVANGMLVHNKGCFLPDTPVLLADGTSILISAVRPGHQVQAFQVDGRIVQATVRRVFTVNEDHYYTIVTESGASVRVTGEHPMYVGDGRFQLVKSLKVGDSLVLFREGLQPDRIQSLERTTEPVTVYNLQTDFPNTYVASRFAVHNKGGGGGGGHGGGSRGFTSRGHHYPSCSSVPDAAERERCENENTREGFYWLLFFVIFAWGYYHEAKKGNGELDLVLPATDFAPKADQTEALIRQLAQADPVWDLADLQQISRRAFVTLQRCWQERDYGPMRPLVFPDVAEIHRAQIQGLIHAGEINVLDDLVVRDIRFIQVRQVVAENLREFTVIAEARVTDHYVNEQTQLYVRGDQELRTFQEYWTFQYFNDTWLLREITQISEKAITDFQNELSGGPVTAPRSPSAPSPSDSKITRLIREYAARDSLWDQTKMLQKGRALAIAYCTSLEAGNSVLLRDQATSPFLNAFNADLERAHQKLETRFFKNLCCRNVEIVQVNDQPVPTYLIRAAMHAQQLLQVGSEPVRKDPDVRPFTLFLTFQREGREFLLLEAEMKSEWPSSRY